jgi:FkbM family methyltransferase
MTAPLLPAITLSYAQNMEDVVLRQVFEDRARGTYVDVGAGHPVADNVTFWFYLQGWSGIVVEPQKKLAGLYPAIRPRDHVFEGLVGDKEGEATFYVVDRLHGLSSTVEANAGQAGSLGAAYRTQTLPMTRLTALCTQHGLQRVDVLKVDVEGAEDAVLAGLDLDKVRPRVILVEAIAPITMAPSWEGWEPRLTGQGYLFAHFDGLNRFYVDGRDGGLLARFPAAQPAWDSVAHLYDFGRAHMRADHPDHALARRLTHAFLAALPKLDASLLKDLLAQAELQPAGEPSLEAMDEEAMRAALGRIACAYDGGHIMDDVDAGKA